MRLSTRLTILFAMFAILPILAAGYITHNISRNAIEHEIKNHLVSTNLLKHSELDRWINDSTQNIRAFAQRPLVIDYAAILSSRNTASPEYQEAHRLLVQEHLKPRLSASSFSEIFIMCPEYGIALASTDETREGISHDSMDYFINGKSKTYLQGVYYSTVLEQPAMTLATPVTDKEGNLVAVVAGRLNLADLSSIISAKVDISQSEDTYLVNDANFFVTEPRFGEDYALKKTIHTEGVNAGLSGKDGVSIYPDYRGKMVIGAYNWLSVYHMTMITEVDQEEAFAPLNHLALIEGIIAAGFLIIVVIAGLLVARTFTRPIHQLVEGTERIGSGNLDYKVGTNANDEIGILSRAIDEMTNELKMTLVSRNELAQSEERFRIAAESAMDLIFEYDVENGRLNWFGDIDGTLGYGQGEFPRTQEGWLNAIHPDDRERVNNAAQRHFEYNEPYEVEFRIRSKNGSYRYWISHGKAVRDSQGKIYKAYGASSDITKRKQAEELFRTMAENSALGIYIVQNNRFVYTNPQFNNFTGYTSAELVGMNPLNLVSPADRKKVRANAVESLKNGRNVPYEYPIIAKTGEIRWALETVATIEYEGKQATIGSCQDITEHKNTQQQLIVTDRLASIGQLVSGVAHELNNPLTGIIGLAQLLLKSTGEPEARENIALIHKEAQRMSGIIKSFLTFARTKSPPTKRIDINAVINAVLEMRSYEYKVNNINVIKHLAPDLPPIQADYLQIQQVFLNIILNAEQAMLETHHQGTLTITSKKVDNAIRIYVSDTGPGIPAEILPRIFDPFFTTKEIGKGTGLGLSICHGIINAHKGKIWAESIPGNGATFIVELPL